MFIKPLTFCLTSCTIENKKSILQLRQDQTPKELPFSKEMKSGYEQKAKGGCGPFPSD